MDKVLKFAEKINMKAILRTKAGKNFSTMKVETIESPEVKPGELKISMVSSRINPVDMDLMKGFPSLKYKNPQIGGIDGAGIVLETGQGVSDFRAGDKVFFYRLFSDIGTWAEVITIKAIHCAKVPENIDIQEAGAIALPLLTAFDSLQQFNAKKGEKLLIHGVGGGVGFQALQLAKLMGLYVIGTASQKDRVALEEAGLDLFIDYRTRDFAQVLKPGEVNFVFDTLGDEVLKKSIALLPSKIVSVKFVDPRNMHKAGVSLPGFLKWLMNLMMRKFTRIAEKNKVALVGQVTGADGVLLQKAANMLSQKFISRKYEAIALSEIAVRGLSGSDVGKVILFRETGN